MKKPNLQQKKYTTNEGIYQLILPINYEVLIPEDDSVRLLSQILEDMDYTELYGAYSTEGRKPGTEPKIMFKILVYAYMNGIYSSRKIETACRRDVNFMWLLRGETIPDHTTINRFRKHRMGGVMEGMLYQFVKILYELGEVKYENIFIDGTKLEANANRYTFVWKKAVEKNEAKMQLKIKDLAEEIQKLYFREFSISKETMHEDIRKMITFLEQKKIAEKIEFVYGRGKRKIMQKAIAAYRFQSFL